jgi:predicted ATPase
LLNLPHLAVAGLFDLVSKSLIAAAVDGTVAPYQLLDTTRAYALEKLAESGELGPVSHCHAEYVRAGGTEMEARSGCRGRAVVPIRRCPQ